ncbi:MAG: dipeptide/oligopeptide/nickel ABC transporter ATP-binding protein [Eubacteriales bacterium]|nr:dipeptide/oligopeptide/nickel ABC transporter ATP-binding protein [Eubacteriales bacterium]
MLEMRQVSKSFGKRHTVPVLDQVDFCLEEQKITALMGPSGSGKSTLARILLFLEQPDAGEILYNGKPVNRKNRKEVLQFRRKVQYISQRPESFFDPMYKLSSSVLEAAGVHGIPISEAKERLKELLELVKINDAVLERYPYQVSGGEIQRVALCRALLLEPEVLILDEATSMLDVSVQAQILNLLKDLKERLGLTYLFIAHDREVVKWFADQALELRDGKLWPLEMEK